MNLILNNNDKVVSIDREISPNELINEINNLIGDELIFSHVVINGQEIYSNLEEFLANNIKETEKIEVIARTRKEFVHESLLSAKNYLAQTNSLIDDIVSQFYSNPSSKEWGQFGHLVDGLQWLTQLITNMDGIEERPRNWGEYVEIHQKIQNVVMELGEAVEQKDNTLIGDIINYEMKPTYEELNTIISNTINNEGNSNDVN
ncbi:hypothetical protein [Saliterribacillus persicus]|uniref:Uncharacterized protein n=1 Tax=Saliterribacillus persicus TaxID=930114 RepID=A0A368Y3G3_9BACI|nr:hypothetical protein [Saliterribacillus persicus]RCW74722.1 hypothetical protein DFR57_10318 [Saliterribacillus persicus]